MLNRCHSFPWPLTWPTDFNSSCTRIVSLFTKYHRTWSIKKRLQENFSVAMGKMDVFGFWSVLCLTFAPLQQISMDSTLEQVLNTPKKGFWEYSAFWGWGLRGHPVNGVLYVAPRWKLGSYSSATVKGNLDFTIPDKFFEWPISDVWFIEKRQYFNQSFNSRKYLSHLSSAKYG